MANNVLSKNITVFPSSNRNTHSSTYMTEENMISLTNRLVGNKSFVIEGLELTSDKGTGLTKGACCIHGYLFNITNDITNLNTSTTSSSTTDKYCYFHITLSKDSGDDYYALKGKDSGDDYTGLEIVFADDTKTDTDTDYYLLIAKSSDNGTTWENSVEDRLVKDNPYYIDDGELSES